MSRAADLRADYELMGQKLEAAEGAAAAALVRERRLVGELLEALEQPEEVALVDQLAPRRNAKSRTAGVASRRRKSG
jgi:hypothetical protein